MNSRKLRDINAVISLSEMFIYQKDGEEPYTNHGQMMSALRVITDAVLIMEKGTIDAHKTKQLANVFAVLTERTFHENAIEMAFDKILLVKDMMFALERLIKSHLGDIDL
jgi:hypothetical protein